MRTTHLTAFLLVFVPGLLVLRLDAQEIVDHPSKLVFPDLRFTPPEAAEFRHVLPCGVVVYVVEDRELPLVDVNVLVRTGTYMDPRGKEGLAAITGSQMRAGGTEKHSAQEFDEEIEFLAAMVNSSVRSTEGYASLNCLTKDLDRAMELFFEMLRSPRFDPERLALKKSQDLQELARRNDQTSSIEGREWERLLRGSEFFAVDRVTKKSIESISRDDLISFHRRQYHPRHFLVAVAGDVKAVEILEKLEVALRDWAATPPELKEVPPVPKQTYTPEPGLYLVDKADVNQGRVSMGHLGPMRESPDFFALSVMNHILGGGAFTSRITSRVRSDKGLAYSAGCRLDFGVYFDGSFRAYFQTKSESVAEAAAIVKEEIEKMRSARVSQDELETAINYYVGTFPRFFANAQLQAGTFASDEFTGRNPAFWQTYCEKMKSVTAEDVQRVARDRLHPQKLITLIVGNAKAIEEASAAALEKLAAPGKVQRIPLPDPLTLEYPKG